MSSSVSSYLAAGGFKLFEVVLPKFAQVVDEVVCVARALGETFGSMLRNVRTNRIESVEDDFCAETDLFFTFVARHDSIRLSGYE